MVNYSTIPTRLAAALLLYRGEISFSEIRELPLVEDERFALAIADILAQNFKVERSERRVNQSASQFEDVIRLLAPPDGDLVARLVGLKSTQGTRRFGALRDRIVVDDRFFEPLPESELARWES